jgi:hypothetical protein
MATRKITTHFPVSTSKRIDRVSVSTRQDHLKLLLGYAEISGESLSSLVDQALQDFIYVSLQSRAEGMLAKAKQKQRADRKAMEREEIAACLASLERLTAMEDSFPSA